MTHFLYQLFNGQYSLPRTSSMIATSENCIISIPETAFKAPPCFLSANGEHELSADYIDTVGGQSLS